MNKYAFLGVLTFLAMGGVSHVNAQMLTGEPEVVKEQPEQPQQPEALDEGEIKKTLRRNRRDVQRATDDWIEKVWFIDRRGLDKKRFEETYDNTRNLVVFDQVLPGQTVIEGWDNYKDVWYPILDNHKMWEMSSRKVRHLSVGLDYATVAMTVKAVVQRKNAEAKSEASFHVTLVWKKGRGGWEVVHQHVSGPVKEPQQ